MRFGCEHIHTNREETLHAIRCGYGVTHTYSRGSIIVLQHHCFTPIVLLMGVTTPMLFRNSYEKSMGVGTPTTYRQGCVLYENHGCMDTHEVLHVSFKTMYGHS